uniref:Diphthamide biosynthesis protein 3 n=1 Tax=Gallus gallus TaxID=9031 RepID=A0A8V0XBM1_CHICK
MAVFHDEVEIEDFEYDEETETYSYPCPCGDRFLITREDLENGEDVATCPSCSLILRVIYDQKKAGCPESSVISSDPRCLSAAVSWWWLMKVCKLHVFWQDCFRLVNAVLLSAFK